MIFKFPEPLSREVLLRGFSSETYLSYYLGIKVDKKLHCNPLRKDQHPTASFYRGKSGEILFHDFALGKSFTFIDVVMSKYGIGYSEALARIASDFGIRNTIQPIKPIKILESQTDVVENKTPAKIQVTVRDFTKEDLSYWQQYGITKKTLQKYKVFSCAAVFLNGSLRSVTKDGLAFGYFGGIDPDTKQELWRVYYPNKKSGRFLTNWKKQLIQGWDQLPKKGPVVVITKAMKDVMLFRELGIPACAPNSERFFLTDEQKEDLKKRFKRIVVLFDTDLTGINSMRILKKKFPEFIYTYIPRHLKSKDISDYCKANGVESTKHLIKSYLIWLSQQN